MKHILSVASKTIVILMVALLYHQTCLAQIDSWERVKLIEQGKNVQVKLQSGKTVKGKLESWNADGLTVRQGRDKLVPLAKSDMAQVAMVIGKSRGRKAAYAGLIGGAIGGGLFAALCASGSGGCDAPPAAIAAGGAILVGGIAAGISALLPQHKEVFYAAKSAP